MSAGTGLIRLAAAAFSSAGFSPETGAWPSTGLAVLTTGAFFGSPVAALVACAACVSCDCGAAAAGVLTEAEEGATAGVWVLVGRLGGVATGPWGAGFLASAARAGVEGVCDCAATTGLPRASTPNVSISARRVPISVRSWRAR
jgi:hypothetical protein